MAGLVRVELVLARTHTSEPGTTSRPKEQFLEIRGNCPRDIHIHAPPYGRPMWTGSGVSRRSLSMPMVQHARRLTANAQPLLAQSSRKLQSPSGLLLRTGALIQRASLLAALSLTLGAAAPAFAQHAIIGAIRQKYDAMGGAAYFGGSFDVEQPTFDGEGRFQSFQYGDISWHWSTGAFVVGGAIRQRWWELGAEAYGYPITDESGTPDGVGRYNHFRVLNAEDRSIYWTPTTGAQAVRGDIRWKWASLGWENSALGYPVTEEFSPVDGQSTVRQNFQKGTIRWSPQTGPVDKTYFGSAVYLPLSVLMCKFSDRPEEPRNIQFFREFLTDAGLGTGGLADYVDDQSTTGTHQSVVGTRSLKGSTVRGWFTMPVTLQQSTLKTRSARINDCVNAAASGGYNVPSSHRVVVLVNAGVDAGSIGTGGAILDSNAWSMDWAAHEVLHTWGFGHSYSDDTNVQLVYNDPWDIMSALNIFTFPTINYGTSAVGMNAFHRQKFGGLASENIKVVDTGYALFDLFPLDQKLTFEQQSAPKMIKVLIPNDSSRYYTVEYRRPTGWSAGAPAALLIHEVRNGVPYLLLSPTTQQPLGGISVNGVHIYQHTLVGAPGFGATVRVAVSMP
jgi:hypothetical protein